VESANIIYVNSCSKWFRSCRTQTPEVESGDNKEFISFAVLFLLNILCDIIHDVLDKHVYYI